MISHFCKIIENFISHTMCNFCKKQMVHKGEIIEKAVRSSGISITVLSKRIGKSRRHIYNIFNNSNVDWEMILKISKAIHYDFSKDFTDLDKLNKYGAKEKLSVAMEDNSSYNNDPDYWKNKYLELLEDYNKLLKEYFTKFVDKK